MPKNTAVANEQSTFVADTGVNVRWLEHPTHPADVHSETTGWITHMVEANYGDENVGYLRIAYMTKESSLAAAPDGLHFMTVNGGWCLNFEDPVDLWLHAHLYASATPLSMKNTPQPKVSWQLARRDAPTLEVIESDLAPLHALGERKRKVFLARCANPEVSFVRVDNGERSGTNWLRRGIARAMYTLAARELATRNMVLMASTLQTEHAQALWAALEADSSMPTRRIRIPGSKRSKETCLVLDYR